MRIRAPDGFVRRRLLLPRQNAPSVVGRPKALWRITEFSTAGVRKKSQDAMAPGVGFEPTTDRLTVDCSTAELPRNSAYRLAVRGGYNDPLPAVKAFFASLTSVHLSSSITPKVIVTRRWRPNRESNSGTRICSPLHSHSAIRPAR